MNKMLRPLACLSLLGICTPFTTVAADQANEKKMVITIPVTQNELVEVTFVLDATGSMSSLIEGAKKKIWSIANTIVDINPNAKITMSLIAYRDRGDAYTVKVFHKLDDDIQSLYSKLLTVQADGGGDIPESVNEALNVAINKVDWNTNAQSAKRIVFLVGDAQPHMDYMDEKQFPAILTEANEKNIIVNTVQAGLSEKTEKFWNKIAKSGKGMYIAIPQDGGQVVQIKTPFDDEIVKTQDSLDKTVIAYGKKEQVQKTLSKLSDKKRSSLETQVENAAYYSKKSGKKVVITGGGDLVADVIDNKLELEKLDKKSLPEKFKDTSVKEIKSVLKKTQKQRQELESTMVELMSKRDEYIKKNSGKDKNSNSFDAAVKDILIEQLQK